MRQATQVLHVETHGKGLTEITRLVAEWVGRQGMGAGLLTIFCRHTSASLLIQENAAPEARDDLQAFFERLAPEREGLYRHDDEGRDDMPAHIRAALTNVSLSIPVMEGRLVLGAWQGLFLFEHRRAPRRREIALHLLGA